MKSDQWFSTSELGDEEFHGWFYDLNSDSMELIYYNEGKREIMQKEFTHYFPIYTPELPSFD